MLAAWTWHHDRSLCLSAGHKVCERLREKVSGMHSLASCGRGLALYNPVSHAELKGGGQDMLVCLAFEVESSSAKHRAAG